ncbi:LysR family transcriptional regulator [Vibrio sp. SM6]|uniref:LysR family transcriptional regulator n=1 Tax=Vibrio agarilyticus TaxID=2726741 RepID=A0A7X8TNX4_9VIBR|nr:LysR family transcriptional regulator [Vibrio agarilyticus]NLS11911.1 LysR family transcriptional regulator [Vibrio agarilyticus]
MSYPIDTLRMFCLLAEKLSFTEAAEALNVSQPTLSRKISQLEQSVKLRLFHRGGNQIHLTPQGIVFLESCQRILQDLDDTLDGLHDTTEMIRGDITIGLLHPMARWLSPVFFREFCDRHPEIRIHLVTLHPASLREMAACDIMISPLLPVDHSLVAKPLMQYRRIFCAAPEYLSRMGTPQHPSELEFHHCITNTNAPKKENTWFYENHLGESGTVSVDGIISSDSVDIAINLAVSGMGVALVPSKQIVQQKTENQLVELFDGEFCQCGQMYAVYRSRKYQPMRFHVFMEELRAFLTNEPYPPLPTIET